MLKKSLKQGNNNELELILRNLEHEPENRDYRSKMVECIARLESIKEINDAIEKASAITGIEYEVWQKEIDKQRKQEKQDQKEKTIKPLSFYTKGEVIVEQVYRDGESLFLVYNNKTEELAEVRTYEDDGCIIKPLDGDELEQGAVKLPTGTAEYDSTTELLKGIKKHLNSYLDVPDLYLLIASCYVLVTWLYDRFQTIPYLRALGDTGCGKSRLLDSVGGLCYKSMIISGAVTPAPIYRMIKKWGGTLIIDEADMKHSDLYSDIITILNCGFEKGRPVIKANMDNQLDCIHYNVYCPKVLATRRTFVDKALEARCLTQVMRETDRTEIPFVLNNSFFKEQQLLRNKLLLFRFRNYFSTGLAKDESIELTNIEPRLQQIAGSIMRIIADDNNSLNDFKTYLDNHQKEIIKERSETVEGEVLHMLFMKMSLANTFKNSSGTEFLPLSSHDIADGLDMTANVVGQTLKRLGISTKTTRKPDEAKTTRCIIYDKPQFDRLKKRYLLKEDIDCDPVTSVTSVSSDTGNNQDNQE